MTGFGIALWEAANAGDELIERHDETTTGAGDAHEELYLVLDGRATFTVDGEEVDAPAGTCVLVEVGTMREAVAAEPRTRVLALGGKPGAALPASPFEHYYAAQPAYDAGDFDRAVEIAGAGLADWPDHPLIHYQLAATTLAPAAWTTRAARWTSPSPATSDPRLGGRGRRPRRAAVGAGWSSALRLRRCAALTASPRERSPRAPAGRGASVAG